MKRPHGEGEALRRHGEKVLLTQCPNASHLPQMSAASGDHPQDWLNQSSQSTEP